MTTEYDLTNIWSGETVAVLASGSSINQTIADELARHRRIVVNYSYLLAPDADLLLALDLNMDLWNAAKNFAGMRACGVQSDNVNAIYIGQMSEKIRIAEGHIVEMTNSGIAAIRLAAKMGAAKIILAGFNPDSGGHFEGRPSNSDQFTNDHWRYLSIGLGSIVSELRAKGIDVEFYSPKIEPVTRKGRHV